MPTITEGNLAFTFPDNWRVIKYDSTDFYRHNIPVDSGFAAVDFIAIPHPGFSTLLLMEVKDFRDYARENRRRQAAGELVNEVIKKSMDSVAGLYMAAYKNDEELNPFCDENLLLPARIEIILFMEEGPEQIMPKLQLENHRKRIAGMSMKLKRLKFRLNVDTRIINTALLQLRDGFTVAHL